MATRRGARQAGLVGMQATLDALNQYGKNMDDQLKWAVDKTAGEVLELAQRSINRKSRGEKVGNRYVSKPGDAPNTDSGDLLKSLKVVNNGFYADVGTDLFYAPWLEFGTQNMPARPFLAPALKRRRFVWFKRLKEIAKEAGVKVGRKGKRMRK